MDENSFAELHGFFIEDLKINQTAEYTKTVTENDIKTFVEVSGDDNPVHTNEEFAKRTIFKKKIAHGFLTASFISTVIATKLPGPGCIYISQSLKFLAPVFINDTINVKVKIVDLNIEKKRVKLLTECCKNEKKILTGEAEILVGSKLDLI
tara:strand:- start:713 stop:1165 length:453 start_codon:yes stop_codon:yes gene_type:complete